MPVESAADRAALFSSDEFAEAAVYTPPGGPSVAVSAIVDRGERAVASDFGGGVVVAGPKAQIRKDQLAEWRRDAVLAISGGETFTVKDGALDESGQVWTLNLRIG